MHYLQERTRFTSDPLDLKVFYAFWLNVILLEVVMAYFLLFKCDDQRNDFDKLNSQNSIKQFNIFNQI